MRPRQTLFSALLFGLAFFAAADMASAALGATHSLRWYRRHHITPPWEMKPAGNQTTNDDGGGDGGGQPADDQSAGSAPAGTTNTSGYNVGGGSGTIIPPRTAAYDSPGGSTAVAPLIGGMKVGINRCVQGWCLITSPVTGWVMEIDINR
jgi:hypothetical protein